MITEQFLYTFGWTPWSSIIAGSVSALAVSVILAILGVALGFTVVSPKSSDPASGLGTTFGIWGGISIIISMAAGGFVAGLLAGQRGLEIGFLVWALTVLAAMCVSGMAISVALKIIGSTIANIGLGAATVAGGVGKGAIGAASGLFHEIKDNIHFAVDAEKVNDHLLDVLRDTGVDSLQPECLCGQLREMKSEAKHLIYQLTLNPSEYERTITCFLDKTKGHLESLTKDVDKDVAIDTIAKNRNIPREEAAQLVDNALHALEKTREGVAKIRTQVEDARHHLKRLTEQARDKADKFADAAAKTALCAAIALILAAVISMGAGYYGAAHASSLLPVAGQMKNISIVQ